MVITQLKELRETAGLTQVELATRASVSRQLVGAVEAGRHLPRVDAAIAIAAVLGVDVPAIFASSSQPVDVIAGSIPDAGSLVRIGSVGDQIVTAPARVGPDGWGVADGVIEESGSLTSFGRRAPGLVVTGCEPGLEVLERMLREQAMGAVAALGSSKVAMEALVAGRVHAAVVHGPALQAFSTLGDIEIERFHLARWQVGLAVSSDAPARWWQDALLGRVLVAQREQGAGVQRAFEEAVAPDVGEVSGPRVSSHMEAAQRAVLTGMPAVTIEPAALALGASFHPLEVHKAEIWVARSFLGDRPVVEAMNVLASRRFQSRLRGVGGYDLTDCGTKVA
ncbi:MAG: helix-turn-helix domain-containing protein [Actinomycetota bacterium]|nr:helix-turn-helix domain-containing protein [Actinomycetota bacterium]